MRKEVSRKHELRAKRQMRIRKKLHGTRIKPRLTVMKSNKHIHVQLIDDDQGHTLGAVSTASDEFRSGEFTKKNKDNAKKIGEAIGAIALGLDIKEIIFDRGPYKYHGILAELADGARAKGLKF